MFHILTNPVNRENDAAEGTQNQYDIIRNTKPTNKGPMLNRNNFLGVFLQTQGGCVSNRYQEF